MKKYVFYIILAIFLSSCAAPAMHGPFYVGKPYGGPAPYGEGIHPGIDFDISRGTPIIAVSGWESHLHWRCMKALKMVFSCVVLHGKHFKSNYAHLGKVFVMKNQLLKKGPIDWSLRRIEQLW